MKRAAALAMIVGSLIIGSPDAATSPTTANAATPTPTTVARLVPEAIMHQWNRVAWCESHGRWNQVNNGAHAYSGALGIRNDVWIEYGGYETFGAPTAGHATPEQQVVIARRIQALNGVPNYVPDQNGACHAW